ncbi:hypothetical protein GCM10009799_36840 [Nocardiopsis rhodophaea]|uniref:Thioester domain-containing protein n=2 Tax=Nocardiopsis rhodophaea TaxID=280238 RepID=A0ABP5EWJ2_9ACTN
MCCGTGGPVPAIPAAYGDTKKPTDPLSRATHERGPNRAVSCAMPAYERSCHRVTARARFGDSSVLSPNREESGGYLWDRNDLPILLPASFLLSSVPGARLSGSHPRMRHILRRCGAVLTTVAALCLGAAPTDAADGIARVDRDPVSGETIRLSDGTDVETSLYHLRVDGTTSLPAYCADISTSVDRTAAYTEASWETDPAGRGIDPGPVSWIVRNSYPKVDLDQLGADSGVAGLGKRQAIAGTQAAIWHFTNDIELEGALNLGDRRSAAVSALYDYLVGGAAESATAPPVPSVAVTPDRIAGADPAEPLGPLTVRTTDDAPVAVAVKGARSARLIDGEGAPITEVPNGETFYVEVDPAVPEGIATVYARAENAVLAAGGLFTGKDGVRTQPLVTAGAGTSSRTASAKVDWSGDRSVEETAEAPSPPPTPTSAPSGPAAPTASVPSPPPPAPADSPGGVVVADDRRPENELGLTGTWAGSLILGGAALLVVGASVIYLSQRNHRK